MVAPGATPSPGFEVVDRADALVGQEYAESVAAGLASRLYAGRLARVGHHAGGRLRVGRARWATGARRCSTTSRPPSRWSSSSSAAVSACARSCWSGPRAPWCGWPPPRSGRAPSSGQDAGHRRHRAHLHPGRLGGDDRRLRCRLGRPARRAAALRRRDRRHVRAGRLPHVLRPQRAGGLRRLARWSGSSWPSSVATCSRRARCPSSSRCSAWARPTAGPWSASGAWPSCTNRRRSVVGPFLVLCLDRRRHRRAGHDPGAPDGDAVIPIVRVNLRRAVGDRRFLFVATVFPVLFILVTGLLAGSPKEPVGLVHPSARLLELVDAHRRPQGPDRARPGAAERRHPARAGRGRPGRAAGAARAPPRRLRERGGHDRARSRRAPTSSPCST